jgi:hypothetical protein
MSKRRGEPVGQLLSSGFLRCIVQGVAYEAVMSLLASQDKAGIVGGTIHNE